MDSKPLVSVIIPCYNYAHFLGEAIESVLAQTYRHFEVIVVDDGSTDNTLEVASRYPEIRLIQQLNQGVSRARNTGLRNSTGDYVVFLDADDRLLAHALKVGLKCLKEHPECAFVCGHCRLIASDESLLWKLEDPYDIGSDFIFHLLMAKHFVLLGTVIFRRSVFESVSGFNASYQGTADYELYYRIAWKFPVYWHDEVVVQYRRHSNSMSLNYKHMLKDNMRVLRLQWRHIKGDERLEEAYRNAMRDSQEYVGKDLCREVNDQMACSEWKQAIQGMLVLLSYHPRGLLKLLLPKIDYVFFRGVAAVKHLLLCTRKSLMKDLPKPIYEGYLDSADGETIEGWAWDENNSDIPISVDIYADNRLFTRVPANEFRKDLLTAGKGDGYHAFCYYIPRRLKDGESHSISVRVTGSDVALISAPEEIQYKFKKKRGDKKGLLQGPHITKNYV